MAETPAETQADTAGVDKIKRFKELIKQKYSVRRALKEAGFSRRKYLNHYNGIWSACKMSSSSSLISRLKKIRFL